MPIKVTCNNCGGVLHAPDDAAGKRGRCPTCGQVLTIAAEAPRVPPSADPRGPSFPQPITGTGRAPTPPLTESSTGFPSSGTGTYGVLPPQGGPAMPAYRPPLGDSAVAASPFAKPSPRLAPPPGRPDPFAKPGGGGDPDAAAWSKVRRGLGWIQTAAVLLFLAAAACPAIEAAGRYGVALPNQDPGYLKVNGLSAANEIRTAAVAGPLLLGLLCLVFGRLGVGSAPPPSFARGPAKGTMFATVLGFLAFVAAGVVTGLGVKDGYMPTFGHKKFPAQLGANEQYRMNEVLKPLFLPADEASGQIQRVMLLTAVGSLLAAELWYAAALGRIAAALRHPTAAGRANRYVVFGGLLLLFGPVAVTGWHVGGGEAWFAANLQPKWDGLDEKVRALSAVGGVGLAALLFTVVYLRLAGGVKAAIRDAGN